MAKALTDRVVVKEIKPEKGFETESGILLDKTAIAQAHTTAKVVMAGDDVKGINVGDTVIFTAGIGNPILIEGVEFLLLRAEQLDIVL